MGNLVSTVDKLNCILLSYQAKYYLLPEVAMQDVIIGNDTNIMPSSHTNFLKTRWQDHELLLVNFDLSPFDNEQKRVKLIVLQLPSVADTKKYIAVPSQGIPHKIKLHSDDICWENPEQKLAILGKDKASGMKVCIPDIEAMSKLVAG